ncbi:uncharacterized protein LOC126990454 isoform X1 [Eriocheir sinensis]|uniref:uncharacterized protein LOC126990454 isoform X1 n=1 Tax=Eriocheir sinensis TaxID=95602 RepID=UPI0021C7C1B0|nr:uncharacterized protein LOC126990454 isoform X1 [Eriocheir sinensis]
MSGPPELKVGFGKDKWRRMKSTSEDASKSDEDIIRAVLAKFHVPKKVVVPSPYVPPLEQELFEHSGRSVRQLHQELVRSGKEPLAVSRVRRGPQGIQKPTEQLGPPRRSRISGPSTQPLTAREYLSTARSTARDKNLARVAEVESQRLQEELQQERAVNTQLETQLKYHEEALQEFLQHHYSEVTDTMTRGECAKHNMTEAEIRIDYYSGLLAEAKTVKEEEAERLQVLTAFQQFLAAVTPSQSLKDLKRKIHEIQERVKESSSFIEGKPIEGSELAELARAVTVATTGTQAVSPRGEGGGGGTLGADLALLRMLRTDTSQSRSSSGLGSKQTPMQASEVSEDKVDAVQEDDEACDHEAFDQFLGDDEHLVDLASMYESQCHALLGLLTRIQNQTEALNKEVDSRQKKLNSRLQEIEQLQEKARGGGHEGQLQDLQTLIGEWPRLSGDAEAQAQLDKLVAQIAEVVSDVFGSSKYSPLVPQAVPEVPPLKKLSPQNSAAKTKGGGGGGAATEGKSSPGKESPVEEVMSEPTVSAGMGQEALLALLEARVTDLCAQLDNIDPALRDAIFLNCEQSRQARLKEEKRQETEMRRAERKQRHLERAMAEPPSRPL